MRTVNVSRIMTGAAKSSKAVGQPVVRAVRRLGVRRLVAVTALTVVAFGLMVKVRHRGSDADESSEAEEGYVDLREAATRLEVAEEQIDHLVAQGVLAIHRDGPTARFRIDDLDAVRARGA